MTMKLGISPISWRNDDLNWEKNISFEQCIREIADAGFIGTEIGNKYSRDPKALRKTLSSLGLEVSSSWFSTYFTEQAKHEETLSRFLDHLSFLRALESRYINVCECGHSIQQTDHAVFGNKKPVFNDEQWDQLIRGLHQIGRIAHDYGMQAVYHYHAGTGVFTEQEIDFLMQHTSPELVGLLLDTGHAAFAGIDPIQLIKRYGNRIRYVYLKDIRHQILADTSQKQWNFMDAVRAGVFTVPGDGDINFSDVIHALVKERYHGWLLIEAEQDSDKAPLLQHARKSYQYLSTLLGAADAAKI